LLVGPSTIDRDKRWTQRMEAPNPRKTEPEFSAPTCPAETAKKVLN
jgi:hypothetical protein